VIHHARSVCRSLRLRAALGGAVLLGLAACQSTTPVAPPPATVTGGSDEAGILVIDDSASPLEVTTGAHGHTLHVACNETAEVPTSDLTGTPHLTIRRLPEGTVIFDRDVTSQPGSVLVVGASRVVVLPLREPSYGPPFLGTCAT
jgi:hypothetical protein